MKVFGIGFHKTGTKSLATALGDLGYRVTGPNGTRDPDLASKVLAMACELSWEYDAFQDNPWPLLYREMDRLHPGSKFILTVRPAAEWIHSITSFFGSDETPMRQWIYDAASPKGNEEAYLARYNRHNEEVREYFRDRSCDFLEMDFSAGDGWEKMCKFLGKPAPQAPFPHRNKRA
ncbi:MAG: hypothetical protein L0H23_01030 [Luteimonas sp.]|nr:hypothetical protein [Luteimonas sp.]